MATEPTDPSAEAAENFFFQRFKEQLENQGDAEAVLYLRHHLSTQLESVKPEGTRRRVRLRVYQRTSDFTVQLNALTGELRGWHFHALAEFLAKGLDPAEALAVATKAAEPPKGAELSYSGYQEQGGEQVFTARWRHVV